MKYHMIGVGMVLGIVVSAVEAQHPIQHIAHQPVSSVNERIQTQASRLDTPEALTRTIDVEIRDVTLSRAIEMIGASAGLRLSYPARIDDKRPRVSLVAANIRTADAFARILRGTNLEVRTIGGQWLVVERGMQARQGVIVGRVIHSRTKQPVAGAIVVLNDEGKGITTDSEGRFTITTASGTHTLHVRAIGLTRQSQKITVVEGVSVSVEIVLEPSASVLDEVVVTGTVVATARKEISTPITVITATDIERRGITRIDQLFRGEVPGLLAIERGVASFVDGPPGVMASAQLFSRGSSTLGLGDNPVKTFVDGVEVADSRMLGLIDPNSIEKIEIITGPQASTLYGSGAMGGIMQIFTKKGNNETRTDVTLTSRYGTMESNLSKNRTPNHSHELSVSGKGREGFSYALNTSYRYSGAWQPGLFNKNYGASIGASQTLGAMMINGSASFSQTANGTYSAGGTPYVGAYLGGLTGATLTSLYDRVLMDEAKTIPRQQPIQTKRVSTSAGQIFSLNLDYPTLRFGRHQLTIGKSTNRSDVLPSAPRYYDPGDSLYQIQTGQSDRSTVNVNSTFRVQMNWLSVNILAGGSAAISKNATVWGCSESKEYTYVSPCGSGAPVNVYSTRPQQTDMGIFNSLKFGIADHFFFNAGIRAEKSTAFGRKYKVDWTPTNGFTYAVNVGELSIKLLGSYGRATRLPTAAQRDEMLYINPSMDPQVVEEQRANDKLQPEYSKGPQGGIELYYANLGSLTINHHAQTVSNLIERVIVDSVLVTFPSYSYMQTIPQNVNVGTMIQKGWEGTGSINIGPVSVGGTYSWNDSRITYSASGIPVNTSKMYLPTHFGSVSVNYAQGKTTIGVVSNWVGRAVQDGERTPEDIVRRNARLRMSVDRIARSGAIPPISVPGYVKTDVNFSYRANHFTTVTSNISNATNNFSSDIGKLWPTLGRQATFGVSLRYPTTGR